MQRLPPFADGPSTADLVHSEGGAPGDRRTILFAWEMGGGLGHLMQMRPLAEDLARAGHRVFVALRQLERAALVFGRSNVSLLQAPAWAGGAPRFPRAATFSQMLMNVGFGSDAELYGRACAWRNLLRLVRPELVVFDHSPTALLASRGLPCPARRALIGSGFCCPPDEICPDTGTWAVLRAGAAARAGADALPVADEAVLARCNRMLGRWGQPPLGRLGQLYGEVDENFLTTFAELDHFPARAGATYWGPVPSHGGDEPGWPDGPGPRVFAYLKRRDGKLLEELFGALRDAGCSTVAYVEGMDERGRHESPALRLAPRPLKAAAAARACDLAVLHGGHGTVAGVLLAGKPMLLLPLALEQHLLADAVARVGAGEVRDPSRLEDVRDALSRVVSSPTYAAAALAFAERHHDFDPGRQRRLMLERCEALLPVHPRSCSCQAILSRVGEGS